MILNACSSRVAAILLAAAVSLLVYINALTGDFVHDDTNMVLHNPWITDVSHVLDILFSNAWAFEERPSNFYRPVAFLLYMANYYVFGLNAWGFHLTNILLHAGVVAFFFLVAETLFLSMRISDEFRFGVVTLSLARVLALLCALLFATHPIHVEPVAWISGISDLLFSLFFMMALYFYIKPRPGNGGGWAYLACFFLAALSKETALTLPILLFAYDTIVGRNMAWSVSGLAKMARRYMPIILITLAYLLLRSYAIGGFAPASKELGLGAYEYFINVFPLFALYLEKLVLPMDLNIFYGFEPILGLLTSAGIIGVIVVLAYIGGFLWLCRVDRHAAFCLLWIVIPLLPVLYLPALGGNPFSERYLYLPAAGFVFLTVLGLYRVSTLFAHQPMRMTVGFMAVFSLILTSYSYATVTRNTVWHSNVTLWEDAAGKAAEEFPVHINLASAYFEDGRYEEALVAARKALYLNPRSSEALYGLGSIYFELDRMPEAIDTMRLALRLDPKNPVKHYHLGAAYARNSLPEQAILQFRRSISLNPDYAQAYYRLGILFSESSDWQKSVSHLQRAVQIEPEFSDAYYELGKAYEGLNEQELAKQSYRQAVRLNPSLSAGFSALGLLYEKTGDYRRAAAAFTSALEIESNAPALVDLGRVLLRGGMRGEAEIAFIDALVLDPEYAEADRALRALRKE